MDLKTPMIPNSVLKVPNISFCHLVKFETSHVHCTLYPPFTFKLVTRASCR